MTNFFLNLLKKLALAMQLFYISTKLNVVLTEIIVNTL